jgi:hypothetical protein|tara:strand:+ start:224 stop:451 length:228 start_codon:yes stop_codon:yes gene_type:complete
MVSDQIKGGSTMAVKKLKKNRQANYSAKRTFEIDLANMFDRYDAEQHLQDLVDVILGIEDSAVRGRLFRTDRKGV